VKLIPKCIRNFFKKDVEIEPLEINARLAGENANKFRQLMNDTGLRTNQEMLNEALTLLSWAVKETKDGKNVAAVDEANKAYRAVYMTALENVKSNIVNK
jgi:hypothetical protein